MVGLSIIQVTASDEVIETDQVWDDVRAKVLVAQSELPVGTGRSLVNSDFGDVNEIVLAMHQEVVPESANAEYIYTPRQLEEFAERIEEEVELLDSVARVEMWGVQPERIYVEVDSSDWAKLGITAGELQTLFEARNIVHPGGEFDTEDGRYSINPTGEFTSVHQMNELIVGRVDQQLPVRLGDLPVRIDRRYEEPARSMTRLTTPEAPHVSCLVLSISMKSGHNVTDMNRDVDQVIDHLRTSFLPPDLKLTRVNDLPRQVDTRIKDFQVNPLQGVAIVLIVALLTMG